MICSLVFDKMNATDTAINVDSTPDFLAILNGRIEVTQTELKGIRDKCTTLDAQIKNGITRIGSRPRESMDELKNETERLERIHKTTPQSNADERKFMIDIDKLRQKRKALVEYQHAQVEIDALKAQRTELQQQLREKNTCMDQLYAGLRKCKAALKSGVKNSEVVEQSIVVPEDKMAHIIGRGGSSLRQMESDYLVAIDTDRVGGTLRIAGTQSAINTAITAINTIVNSSTDEFALGSDKIACLTLNSAAVVQELQVVHGVRVDLSRAKSVCKISGPSENVRLAKQAILSIPSARAVVSIQAQFLPFIIGKAGATVRQVGDDCQVQIDVSKESNKVEILGRRDNVDKAVAVLNDLIDTNKEVEEVMLIEKNLFLSCIMGPAGSTIRTLQKDLGVFLHSEKGDEKDHVRGKEKLQIRGTATRVLNAKNAITTLIGCYHSDTESIDVPVDCLPAIVGKQGSTIKKMREDFPDVQVDIDGSVVTIHSANSASRQGVREEIVRIVEANFTQSFPLDADAIIVLKSTKGAELRALLTETLALGMDLDTNLVKLRGPKATVAKGQTALEAFQRDNLCESISCSEEDCSALTQGGDASLKSIIETKYGVELYASRKDKLIRIRGTSLGIQGAKESIRGTLQGDLDHDSLVIPISLAVLPSLIGKQGANMKKFEAEFSTARIDLFRDRGGLVRIIGPRDVAIRAKRAILGFLDQSKSSVFLEVGAAAPGEKGPPRGLEKPIALAQSLYRVEISRAEKEPTKLIIRGGLVAVEEAKEYLKEAISGSAVSHVAVSASHITYLAAQPDLLAPLQQHGVTVALDEAANQITIFGPTNRVPEGKLRVVRMLDGLFPSEFISITMNASCLRHMCSPSILADIDSAHKVSITADRPFSCLRIRGSAHEVTGTALLIRKWMNEWNERKAEVEYPEASLPALISKGSNFPSLQALEGTLGVSLDLHKETRIIEIHGPSKEVVAQAQVKLLEHLARVKEEYWETQVGAETMGLIIGKKGANIIKLRSETGARIDVDAQINRVRVTGSAQVVSAARDRLEAIIRTDREQVIRRVSIPSPGGCSAVIGPKGASARHIQDTSGCRLDLDRNTNTAILKGSPAECQSAVELIDTLLIEAGLAASTAAAEIVEVPEGNASRGHVEEDEISPIAVASSASGYSKVRSRCRQYFFDLT